MKVFRKLTEDDICEIIEKEQNPTDYLVDDVKWLFIAETSDFSMNFEFCLAECESPIEQMLAISLERLTRSESLQIPLLIDFVEIENQREVVCNGKKYRVDFAITVHYWDCDKVFVIECDGHEFHQKTKEQVKRDNERTRNLILCGYTVIRFSGTEIFHNSWKCAQEIKKIIQERALKVIKGAIDHETEKDTR